MLSPDTRHKPRFQRQHVSNELTPTSECKTLNLVGTCVLYHNTVNWLIHIIWLCSVLLFSPIFTLVKLQTSFVFLNLLQYLRCTSCFRFFAHCVIYNPPYMLNFPSFFLFIFLQITLQSVILLVFAVHQLSLTVLYSYSYVIIILCFLCYCCCTKTWIRLAFMLWSLSACVCVRLCACCVCVRLHLCVCTCVAFVHVCVCTHAQDVAEYE